MDANSNPRAAQVRLAPASPAKTAGQRKHDLRIGHQPDYVDSTRSHLNRVVIEPKSAAQMKARATDLRDRKPRRRAMKANAAVSFSGIITFGHLAHLSFERLTAGQQDAAFLDLAQAVARLLKAELTRLVVHVDEAGLHAHFQLDAYDADGTHSPTRSTGPRCGGAGPDRRSHGPSRARHRARQGQGRSAEGGGRTRRCGLQKTGGDAAQAGRGS